MVGGRRACLIQGLRDVRHHQGEPRDNRHGDSWPQIRALD